MVLENERWCSSVSERQQMVSGRWLKWRHPHSDSEKLSETSSSVIMMTLLMVSWVCGKQAATGLTLNTERWRWLGLVVPAWSRLSSLGDVEGVLRSCTCSKSTDITLRICSVIIVPLHLDKQLSP